MQNDANQRNTYQAILDSATALVERRGYHAFSYADVSEQVGIRKASIHYYFPNKNDLVCSVIAQYRATLREAAARWQHLDALQQFQGLIDFYSNEVDKPPRMCLCALLGAEMPTLPDDVRAEVQGFYQDQERSLSQLLESGCRDGVLHVAEPFNVVAQVIRAGLEGAMISSRVYNDRARFRTIAEGLIRPYRIQPE